MNTRALCFVLFFAMLLIAPKIVEPAYYFYLLAFAALGVMQIQWNALPTRIAFRLSLPVLLLALSLLAIAGATVSHAPAARDVLRDLGVLLAFFVGRQMFVAYRGEPLQLIALSAVSATGVMVAIVTLGGATLAWFAGVSAYEWRGVYVLWGHTWLPYAIVANIALITIEPQHSQRYLGRIALCAVATVASLSRTDLLLETLFAFLMMWRFRRELLLRFAGLAKALIALMVVAAIAPMFLQLQVVQQRVQAGVGAEDQSLGWRLMEHLALFDYFRSASIYEWLFGFGFGARVPLPDGILDFAGNSSIPTLHDSFGTIALKSGLLGLAIVAWYVLRAFKRSRALRDPQGEPYRWAGRWIVLFCLAKALTLHGLTEWSHTVFFGIGCMLLLNPLPVRNSAVEVRQAAPLGAA